VGTTACCVLILAIIGSSAFAQKEPEKPAGTDESAELAKKLQNPVAALVSVPFQSNFEARSPGPWSAACAPALT